MVSASSPEPIYMVPGLGADARLFGPLKSAGLNIRVLEFLPPIPGEDMAGYALRMSDRLSNAGSVILGGVSLGGIIAVEMSRILPAKQLLLISTVKHRGELPVYFRGLRHFPIHRVLSGNQVRRYAPKERSFGMTKEVRAVMDAMREDADPRFVKWAIDAVVRWSNREMPESYFHLHGTKDLLFPASRIKHADWIQGGGHGIVMTHAAEVAAWIQRKIKQKVL